MLTPEELAAMDARMGANADRMIGRVTKVLAKPRDNTLGRKPLSIANAVQPEMLEVLYAGEDSWPLWVDDICSGVARLDWYRQGERSVPLSKKKIVQCFAMLDVIDSYGISHLLRVGERQAQRYLKACELLHWRLIDGYCTPEVHSLHYPEVFIYPREMIRINDLKEE